MLAREHHDWVRQTFGVDPESRSAEPAPAGVVSKLPAPMQPDCVVVHGKVHGPKHHVLCATHGHILDDQKKLIIAHTLAEYEQAHPKLPAPMQPDCLVVRGKVPGPKHHVLCGTHGHVLDEETHQIIALTVAQYQRHHPWPPAAGHTAAGPTGHGETAHQPAAQHVTVHSPTAPAPTAPASTASTPTAPAQTAPAQTAPTPTVAAPTAPAPTAPVPAASGPNATNPGDTPNHHAAAPTPAKHDSNDEKASLISALKNAIEALTEYKDGYVDLLKLDFISCEGCRMTGASVKVAGAAVVASITTAIGTMVVELASAGTASAVALNVGLVAGLISLTSVELFWLAANAHNSCREEHRDRLTRTNPSAEELARQDHEFHEIGTALSELRRAELRWHFASMELKQWFAEKF